MHLKIYYSVSETKQAEKSIKYFAPFHFLCSIFGKIGAKKAHVELRVWVSYEQIWQFLT